jgi:DNA polymerase-4
VRIKFRYPDFQTFTRQSALSLATDQPSVILGVARELLARNLPRGGQIRLLGLGVSGLLEESGYQLQLFDQTDQKRIHLNQAVDGIREKYGTGAIVRASLLPHTRDDVSPEDAPSADQSSATKG